MDKSSGVVTNQLSLSSEMSPRREELNDISLREAANRKIAKDALEGVRISRHQALRADLVSISEGNRGHRIFAQALSIHFRLESGDKQLDQPVAKPVNPFEPPSPAEVANTILGFVANRLQSEVNSGASQDRISALMDQARLGVTKGFEMARSDLKSLGLMNDQLESEIDDSFNLITDGLGKIQMKFLPSSDAPIEPQSDPAEGLNNPISPPSAPVQATAPDDTAKPAKSERDSESDSALAGAGMVGIQGSSYTEMASAFTLTTQDGDQVSISFAKIDSMAYQVKAHSDRTSLFIKSGQFDGFQVAVKGTLDEGEMKAIGDLLSQVNEVSLLFFEDSFQEAFSSALNVGFDPSEISAFSLNLSKVQIDEVRVYGNPDATIAAKARSHSQPLVDMVNRLGEAVHSLSKFSFEKNDFIKLIKASIDWQVEDRKLTRSVLEEDFSVFTAKVYEGLLLTKE